MLGREPTLIIGTIVACLNSVQLLAISVPNTVHVVILVTVTVLGVIYNRSQVTPVTQPQTQPGHITPDQPS